MKKIIHPLFLVLVFIAGVLSIRSQVVSFYTNTPPVVNQQVSFFTTTPFGQSDTIVIGTQIANMTNAAGQLLFTISQLTNSFTRLNWTLVWQGHNNGNLGTYTNESSVFTGQGQ